MEGKGQHYVNCFLSKAAMKSSEVGFSTCSFSLLGAQGGFPHLCLQSYDQEFKIQTMLTACQQPLFSLSPPLVNTQPAWIQNKWLNGRMSF